MPMIERTLFEYGVWLEENVWSKSWKGDYRRAVVLCVDHRLVFNIPFSLLTRKLGLLVGSNILFSHGATV